MSGEDIRIGLDFGTSTTLVAVRVGNREPRVLRLDTASDEIPSYIALGPDGLLFGAAARNAGVNAHSIKLKLRENAPIPELDGMLPHRAAYELISETVRRTLEALKREGRLPPTAERLEVATNVGCTPRFDLTDRTGLRAICRGAGLEVGLAELVEEPVAGAFEVAYAGLGQNGATMIVDIGGGTLDVAIMEMSRHGGRFVIHATGGDELGGDKFTQVIVDELLRRIGARSSDGRIGLDRQGMSAIWNRAEAAKIALSSQADVRVALPVEGAPEVVLTRDWYTTACQGLLARIVSFVTTIYRQSRLTLGRGGPGDRFPGSTVLSYDEQGFLGPRVERLTLADDAAAIIRNVVLLGGASRMPLIRERFEQLLGDRMMDPAIVGTDPVHAIVLGLARHQRIDRLDIRYPNWGVNAHVTKRDGSRVKCALYEPWAPAFRIDGKRGTSAYRYCVVVPDGGAGGTIELGFQPVTQSSGERWPPVTIPAAATELTFSVDLFGRVQLTAGGVDLYPGRQAPFALKPPAPWLPKGWRSSVEAFIRDDDWRYDTQ